MLVSRLGDFVIGVPSKTSNVTAEDKRMTKHTSNNFFRFIYVLNIFPKDERGRKYKILFHSCTSYLQVS